MSTLISTITAEDTEQTNVALVSYSYMVLFQPSLNVQLKIIVKVDEILFILPSVSLAYKLTELSPSIKPVIVVLVVTVVFVPTLRLYQTVSNPEFKSLALQLKSKVPLSVVSPSVGYIIWTSGNISSTVKLIPLKIILPKVSLTIISILWLPMDNPEIVTLVVTVTLTAPSKL